MHCQGPYWSTRNIVWIINKSIPSVWTYCQDAHLLGRSSRGLLPLGLMALEFCVSWVSAPFSVPQPRARGQAQRNSRVQHCPHARCSDPWLGYLMLSFSHQNSAQMSQLLPFLLSFSLNFLPILKGQQLSLVPELSYSIFHWAWLFFQTIVIGIRIKSWSWI